MSARLTKRYGEVTAVSGLSFDVVPGKVTGFLGPNGAGKTTTMRLILGLDYPNAGIVTIDGKQFSPWGQLTVFAVCTAVLLVVGGILFRKRDA